MANLKDLLVNGPSSLIGDVTVNKIQLTALKAPTASSGSTYGFGSSGQILKTNGSSVYWANDVVSKLGTATVGSSSQPIYLNNGTPLAITCLKVEAGGTGENSRRKAGLFYNWTTSLQGQIWSRICYIPRTINVLGSAMILNIRHTRANVVYNETVMITVHHNSRGNITSLSSSNYNQDSTVQIRAVANFSGDCYIELKDSNQGITEGTAISPVYCTLQIISLGNDEPTLKTSFENGTTLPENYSVAAEVTLGRNRIITSGIFSGNLEGNATTATTAGGITSAGTTAQFWRGDNHWSNILTQTTTTTLGIDPDNSRIGTAARTLHMATAGSATGAGVTDGQAAGLTFGVSSAVDNGTAYAGIYYQASNSYGSRLYFATTNNFQQGSYARMMITHDGKVGIGTLEPQELLEINGNICANNIYPKNSNNNNYSSYDLGKTNARWNKLYVNEFAPDEEYSGISIPFSNNEWQDLKDSSNNLIHLSKSGTYIVQIYDDSPTTEHYFTYWSGIFSWYAGNVNGGGEYTEIPLHGAGHAMNQKSIQLRTCSPPQTSYMKLQIKGNRSNSTNTANNTISIKFKFIM